MCNHGKIRIFPLPPTTHNGTTKVCMGGERNQHQNSYCPIVSLWTNNRTERYQRILKYEIILRTKGYKDPLKPQYTEKCPSNWKSFSVIATWKISFKGPFLLSPARADSRAQFFLIVIAVLALLQICLSKTPPPWFFCHFLNSYHSLNLVSLTPPFLPKHMSFSFRKIMISLYQQKWFFLLREQRTMSKRLIEWFCPTFFLKKKVYNLNERSQVAVFNLSPAAISQHRKKFSRTLLFPQSTGDFPVYNLAKNNDFSRHRMVSSVTDSLLTQHFSFHPFPPLPAMQL